MKGRPKKQPVPRSMDDTVRGTIAAALREAPRSARELSASAGIPEREVPVHLEHIQKTICASGLYLVVIPAECKKCGFIFAKREKLTRPGRCPVCKGGSIRDPRFAIEEKRQDRRFGRNAEEQP